MASSSLVPVLAFALALAACGGSPRDVTALRVATTWTSTDVHIDQLEFTVGVLKGATIVAPTRRPTQAASPLNSGDDVVIYLPEERGGQDIVCDVRGFWLGQVVAAGSVHRPLVARTVVAVEVHLIPGLRSRSNGATCADGGECMSAVCTDGVCCETACTGTCRSCAVPGRQGTCALVPEGVHHRDCADQGLETCGFDGTCDGKGACRKQPTGTRCAAGHCSGSSIIAAGACDGQGSCAMGPQVTCAPFSCDASAEIPRCFDRCDTADQCVSGRECLNNSCGTKQNGASCHDAADCTSGFCVDGTCCESDCKGACLSCANSSGACRFIPDGVPDPRGMCPDDGAFKCGRTGACNGNGGCARYPGGTVCQDPTCASGVLLQSPSRCDGLGSCIPGGQLTCAPFACSEGACNPICTTGADCAPGQVCDSATRSCGQKGTGQPCGAAGECASGFCVDGVCCNNACQGACRSCATGATPGTCANVSSGAADPRGSCKDQGKAACNTDGTCDGNGGCRHYPVGTVCGAGGCNVTTSIRTLPRSCDGSGTCAAGTTVSCGAYKCNGDVCFNACGSDEHCVAPATCIGGACGTRGSGSPCTQTSDCGTLVCVAGVCQGKSRGTACTGDGECASMHCASGVCCDGACSACNGCNVPGFVGFCHALAVGLPDARCATDPAASCHQDGACDGAGACRLYPAGAVCASASCAGTVRTNPKTCDGRGTCQDNGTAGCPPFTCNPATNNCFTTCTNAAQCAPGKTCGGGQVCQ
jgi:hypothetical protein